MHPDRILIVEDEKIIALDLQRRLEKLGYQIVGSASTGSEAVEKASATRPDLILMDIMLSGELDGIEAAKIIRSRFFVPVIFLTAFADENTLERAKEAQPFGYVLKPFKERELHTTIDIALYKSRVDGEMVRQKSRLSAILNGIGDAVIATDQEHRIQFMNPVSERLTGWTESEATEQPADKVIRVVDPDSLLPTTLQFPDQPETTALIRQSPVVRFENLLLESRNGGTIDIQGSVSPIVDTSGTEHGHVIAFRDISRIKELAQTINYQENHDSLTGLANREAFFARLRTVATEAKERGITHLFFYLDLDQFKVVNDVAGHVAGDELLRMVSRDLTEKIHYEKLVGRLGGDEFGVLVENVQVPDAATIAPEIIKLLDRRFTWRDHDFAITGSIGVVPVTGLTTDVYAILAAADDACYLAKEEGGNSYRLYETSDTRFLKRRGEMQWISRLTKALEEDRFVLYCQEIRPLRSGLPGKYEILMRLVEKDGKLIGPMDFIPAAERYNLMPAIDRWVFREAARFIRHNGGSERFNGRSFCVNISGASIADDNLLPFIHETLATTGLNGSVFCFEITETSAIENIGRAIAFINTLRRTGCSFALDDFGNGFSSFAYLKNLPVDYLKIDGSFVKDLSVDSINRAMVDAVNQIGHVLNMKTIAEYVTNRETCDYLTSIGVDYGQGFYVSRPVPLTTLLL